MGLARRIDRTAMLNELEKDLTFHLSLRLILEAEALELSGLLLWRRTHRWRTRAVPTGST